MCLHSKPTGFSPLVVHNIANFIEEKPRKVTDNCECNYKTNLVHNPRNKNSRTNDIIYDGLDERIYEVQKLVNLEEQEIKDLEQKLEELRKQSSSNKNRLANLKRLKRELKEELNY